jgi:heat shock protein HslJ
LVACGPIGERSGALDGTSWRLISYRNAAGKTAQVLPGTEVTAEFREGGIGGNATCNSYFGEVVIKGDQLTVQGIGMTEMYCFPEENMEQEAAYIAALSAAASYQWDGARLTVADPSGRIILTFTRR